MQIKHAFHGLPKVGKRKYKKVSPEQAQKQREVAAKKKRTHIAKARWPDLIQDYDRSMLEGMTAEQWGQNNNVKYPVKAISRWRNILKNKK